MRRRTWLRGLTLAVLAPAGDTLLAPGASAATDLQGIDVGTTQAGIDFALARAQGQQFAIVKSGGCQLAEGPYTSPYYTRQVQGARAAGLRLGHYWLSGDYQTPTAAADYFVDHLHDYRQGDVLALDVEVLDDSTRLWDDTQVATWFWRVRERVGAFVPWFYIGAANLRAGNWPRTIASGAHLWVAAYGPNDGTRHDDPELGGKYPDWAVHQYTSAGSAGGVPAVDLNLARASAFDIVEDGGDPPGDGLPKTTTEEDGVPGPVMWMRTQNWLRIESGYTGPIDGVPGVNTYAALQRNMRDHWGYTGPIDGVPGTYTWMAVQRLAAAWGYTGPVDGVMGPNSWRGFARFINQDSWD
ncbi:muraminidase [Wenjunlia vitaminophila]|uniref:Muraminidase n=2 Tax=Wenjunlia vitaminophila TaxID=76728 RepID=A0A0T6LUL9_WENVI|nr:glycoside hydrolase family 25 protein [Wenjunlia vitaminophila]KRV49734.1 muraminidase [Wenjunlia vitaminophila]